VVVEWGIYTWERRGRTRARKGENEVFVGKIDEFASGLWGLVVGSQMGVIKVRLSMSSIMSRVGGFRTRMVGTG